jgi:hypothetical protein
VARSHLLAPGLILAAALLAGGSGALAQTDRSWVDPPSAANAQPAAPQPPAPQPPVPQPPAPPPAPPPAQPAPAQAAAPEPAPPPRTAQPAPAPAAPARSAAKPAEPEEAAPKPGPNPNAGQRRDARTDAVRKLVMDYLQSWSAPNPDALDAAAAFYAPEVLFHGRAVNIRSLMAEKRRFARRWPERDYRPEEKSIQIVCQPGGETCMAQALFDFTAADPRRDRRTQGTGALQLTTTFLDGRPLISAETSMVLNRSSNDEEMPLEDPADE